MFGKQYESLYTGSMIGSGAVMFAVWGYVLTHRRRDLVELNSVLLAFMLGESEADVNGAIDRLCSPDPRSRTKAEEGRRLVKEGEYVYRVVNAKKFDDLASEYERRERDKFRKREERADKTEPEQECYTGNNAPTGDKQLKSYHPDARAALHILNEASGRHYRETDTNLAFISMRLNEQDVDLAGIRSMILRQCKRWKGTAQAEYLRPETLFGKTKFDGYYAAREELIYDENSKPNPRNVGINITPEEQTRQVLAKQHRDEARRAAERAGRTSDLQPGLEVAIQVVTPDKLPSSNSVDG